MLDIPLYDQLAATDNNIYNDCGPECIQMIAAYYGIIEKIHQIKTEETGFEWWTGYTDIFQMASWFQERGIQAVVAQPQNIVSPIVSALDQDFPIVYLSYWNLNNKTGGHFRVIKGYEYRDGEQVFLMNNPWGGVEDAWSASQIATNSLGNFLCIVQKSKEPVVDSIIAGAVQRYSALGLKPNTDGMLFKAYLRRYKAWIEGGSDAILDPTPAIKPEWSDGKNAYVAFDNGEVFHWRADDGKVYQAEAKEHDDIWKACGWS